MMLTYPSHGAFVGLRSGEYVDRAQIEEVARERVVIRARLHTADETKHQRGEG